MSTTTIEFLKSYTGTGARELHTLIDLVNDPTGKFQTAASAIAGEMHEGEDVLSIFAAWLYDEAVGSAHREIEHVPAQLVKG